MSPIVLLALFGWFFVVVYLYRWLEPEWATVLCLVAAISFLPQNNVPLPVIPDYGKMSATCYAIVFSTIVFHPQRFKLLRLTWFDCPMLICCLSPFVTSIVNGLGLYDAFISTVEQTMLWGGPYFLGRLYIGTLEGLKKLALAMILGGLAYVPLCLYEGRFSPQLHRMVYGARIALGGFSQNYRYGGWRPVVFMQHGLAVGLWMMAITLIAFWLWRTRTIRTLWGIPMGWIVGTLFITFILCRSTGAYFLFILGVIVLLAIKQLKTALPFLLLIGWISLYIFMGVNGTFTGELKDRILNTMDQIAGPERAASLQFRFDMEEVLGNKARQSFLWGWGGFGRNRVYNAWGEPETIPDSLWILAFGTNGVIGVTSLFASLLLPSLSFALIAYRPPTWTHPKVAPAASIAVVVVLYAFDSTLNNMLNAVYVFGAGGLTSLVISTLPQARTTGVSLTVAERFLTAQDTTPGN